MLKGALVGFGQVAEKAHLPAFRERGISIVAVCDGSAARREAAQAALPDAKIFDSYEQMLSSANIDFVDVATPPFLHYGQSLTALKAGKHVLCEKPLALAPEELETLRRTAAMAGKTVFTVHNWAYAPQWLKVFALLDAGAIGDVQHAELHALRTKPAAGALPGDWRKEASQAGGGILIDHGWHNLYLLHKIVKQKPNRVMPRLHPATGGVEDEVSVFVEFPTATAVLHLSWRSAVRRNSARIVGSKGVIDLDDDVIVLKNASGSERFTFEAALSAGSAHPTWFSAMLPDFQAEVDGEGRGKNLEDAAFALCLIHRAYTSARHGRNPLRAALAPRR